MPTPISFAQAQQIQAIPQERHLPQPIISTIPAIPLVPNPPRPPLPTLPQAYQSTYAARLRTGASLLVQPIFQQQPTAIATTAGTSSRPSRRGAVINYADPGSGDEDYLPDTGAIDSDDSDFVASGGTRTAIRQALGGVGTSVQTQYDKARMNSGMTVFSAQTGVTTIQPGVAPTPPPPAASTTPVVLKNEVEQSYLGQVPPERLWKPQQGIPGMGVVRTMMMTPHEYPYVFHIPLSL
jgi:chromatin structure-remodeling complex subunit SFH1